MRRMSGLDAAFLYGETPSWHMHVSAVLLADPSDVPGGFRVERLRDVVLSRLPQAPQFRWKYVEVPFGIDRPGWVEDRSFDIDHHIRRIGVPSPGGPAELQRLIGDLVSIKLDRARPLWEIWVIEGLADGRVALLAKVHHAIVDGVSGTELATVVLDVEADPAPSRAPVRDTLIHLRTPSQPELLARGLWNQMLAPLRFARFGAQSLQQGLMLADFMRRPRTPAAPFQAPRTSFNATISPHRAFATSRVPLDAITEVKDALGVTMNDIVLALCSGALRRYLLDDGELPSTPLVAQVPVSLRTEDQKGDVGVKVGAMFASLATDVDDPIERVKAIHESTQQAKLLRNALNTKRVLGVTDVAAPAFIGLTARMLTAAGLEAAGPPVFNLIVSNVPGPPFPLYVAGARVEAMYPMGPLLYGGGLNITVLSYLDSLDVGVLACREAVPEPGRVADGIPAALAELQRALH
jgi:diacylglycerol O-acyltransferase / wax synthase